MAHISVEASDKRILSTIKQLASSFSESLRNLDTKPYGLFHVYKVSSPCGATWD